MRFLVGRAPKHTADRRRAPRRVLSILTVLTAAGAGLVVGPVVGTLTASPAAATPVISAVGPMAMSFGSGQTTLNVSPQHLGDVLVLVSENDLNTVTVTSISGGGVTTWNNAIHYVGSSEPRAYEIWYGVVTATGSSTATFTLSGSISGHNAEYEGQEFTAGFGAGTIWTLDNAGVQENPSAANPLNYPSLTPAGRGRAVLRVRRHADAAERRVHAGVHLHPNPRRQPGRLQPRLRRGCGAAHLLPEPGVLQLLGGRILQREPPDAASRGDRGQPRGGPLAGGTRSR